jgi:hypothetical protein
MDNERVKWVDVIVKWREHRNALTNGRASTAEESLIYGPLSHEQSLKAAVKYVLKAAGCPVEPTVIREMLREAGFPVTKYRKPAGMIHPTLRRFIAEGQVRQVASAGWKEYEWIGPS